MPPLSPAHAAFGRAIKDRRSEAGDRLSQERLALNAGLDRSYVGSVERGQRNVSLTNILRLAVALDTSPSALLQHLESAIDWERIRSGGPDVLDTVLPRKR